MQSNKHPAANPCLVTIPKRNIDNSVFKMDAAKGNSKLASNYAAMCESGEIKHDENQEVVIKWLENYVNDNLYAN